MPLTKQQLEQRKHGVSGSDLAAVLGLSPWKSPQDVWAEKLDLAPPFEGNAATERGNFLEPAILAWTGKVTGLVIEGNPDRTYQSPEHPLLMATPDGIAYADGRPIKTVEVKSPGPRTARHWEDPQEVPDGIPVYYVPQVQLEMHCVGLDRAIISALIGGDLRVYEMHLSPDFIEAAADRVQRFWRHVERREPIPIGDVQGEEARLKAAEWIRKYYKQESEELLTLDGDEEQQVGDLVKRYVSLKAMSKHASDEAKVVAAQIQERIGEHAGIVGYGWKATWKQAKSSEKTDWKRLAMKLKPSEALITQYTELKPGSRRFLAKVDESKL